MLIVGLVIIGREGRHLITNSTTGYSSPLSKHPYPYGNGSITSLESIKFWISLNLVGVLIRIVMRDEGSIVY